MRIFFAVFFLVAGLVLSAVSLYNGQPIVSLSLALAGGYVGLGILLGVSNTLASPTFQFSAALIGAIGLFGVFFYNRAFDTNLQGAYIEALSDLGTMELRCRPMSAELRSIQTFGVAACASQGNSDQMGAVVELGKGLHFGPTLSLVDTSVTLSKGEHPNYCARAFKAADRVCPLAFSSMSTKFRTALLEAAK